MRRYDRRLVITLGILAFVLVGACKNILTSKPLSTGPYSSTSSANNRFVFPTLQPTLPPAYVVNTFLTNARVWQNNSPDPSGITYDESTGELIIVDSEVDEFPPICSKPNLFYTSTTGVLRAVINTCRREYGFMKEITGVDFNHATGHLFFSDDDQNKIFELDPGNDQLFWTVDDVLHEKDLNGLELDEEDITVMANKVYLANGLNSGYLRFDLGADGILGADDGSIEYYSTLSAGFSDVEGIAHSPTGSSVFILSTRSTDKYLGEFSLDGALLNKWDLSFMGHMPNIRSGLTFAPGSRDPNKLNIYIVSRGFDNNAALGTPFPANPNEDDGEVWEISLQSP